MPEAFSWFIVGQHHKRGCFCFFFFLHYSCKDRGSLGFSSSSWFSLSLEKDLFVLCFVILHWSNPNQRKLGQGCFVFVFFVFFFSVVVLFALTLFFPSLIPSPLFLPAPALLLGPCSLMKSKGCQSMPPTQKENLKWRWLLTVRHEHVHSRCNFATLSE